MKQASVSSAVQGATSIECPQHICLLFSFVAEKRPPGSACRMNLKLTALAALLLAPGQAMAEDLRVDFVTDQRIVCRDDETTYRAPVRESGWYHFTFDLTKKTGSLVFCTEVAA
jgi:hypothetical protein